ncbi:MAG: ParB/RepB/Spo0J family partition protein [Oscillospiraceae bacterium]|nr:ParB/RepB/Spo0J family partition protein [Oscillospiraceae bacterium]
MEKNKTASAPAETLFTAETAAPSPAGNEHVVEIPLGEIRDFPSHPFHVRKDAEMQELVESVRQVGVLIPAVVRPCREGGYEMISGHRRRLASLLAGRETMPCIVRELDDDRAVIVMVDSNLQRESLLPSEKAFAYRMKLEAARRQQGERSDLTSATALQKSAAGKKSTRELLAENSPDSHEQIRKYIRLTYLIPVLLDRVDRGKLPMRSAVELSYLPEEEQLVLSYFLAQGSAVLSQRQAAELRRLSQERGLDERTILLVLRGGKEEKPRRLSFSGERISRFFAPGTSPRAMEETIVKALEQYCRKVDK